MHSPYTENFRLISECTGLPLPHEWREWLRLFAAALGYHEAQATCAYVRWRWRGSRIEELPPGIPRPALPPVEEGVGTELHKLLAELGITPDSSCPCEAMRQKMNAWGPAGCREHREEILAHLRTAYSQTDWPTVFAACLAGIGMVWKINPLHPIESGLAALLDEASERAERQAAEAKPPAGRVTNPTATSRETGGGD